MNKQENNKKTVFNKKMRYTHLKNRYVWLYRKKKGREQKLPSKWSKYDSKKAKIFLF